MNCLDEETITALKIADSLSPHRLRVGDRAVFTSDVSIWHGCVCEVTSDVSIRHGRVCEVIHILTYGHLCAVVSDGTRGVIQVATYHLVYYPGAGDVAGDSQEIAMAKGKKGGGGKKC